MSRARITQIMDLLLLAPEIQEELLFGKVPVGMRNLVAISSTVEWGRQRELLECKIASMAARKLCVG